MSLNFASVGFGAAVLAGLVLAIIGHPAPRGGPIMPAKPVIPNAPAPFALKSVSVELPVSDAQFPGPAHATVINANCLSCHSAGMVLTQPPFTRTEWAAIVGKMIHAYKAPVDETEEVAIVDYLKATKGR